MSSEVGDEAVNNGSQFARSGDGIEYGGPLPRPDYPAAGVELKELTTTQQAEFQRLLDQYLRLLDWQAELVNRSTVEDCQTYCEELDAGRENVETFP